MTRAENDTARADAALSDATLPGYLRRLGLVAAGEAVGIEPAGDGNINWVRRVRVGDGAGRSFVVKQARPALERFPQYRASTERIVFERRWLELARPLDRDRVCPEVIAFDEARRVLVLEDLGDAERLDHALARGIGGADAAAALAALLGAVHAATSRREAELAPRFANDDMRRLHGDHVFALPLRPNDFPLPDPVRRAAERVWADGELVATADRAYARYLEPRGALVHGDVQAGNVLLAERGPVLLDAEIAHVGDPAFDAGTLVAHLLLPAVARGAAAEALPAIGAAWSAYGAAQRASTGAVACPPFADVARYAAIEMLRRTIGAARVAAVAEPGPALAVLETAIRLMREPAPEVAALAAAASRTGAGREVTR